MGFTLSELAAQAQAVSAQLTAHARALSNGGGEVPRHNPQEPRAMRPATLRASPKHQPPAHFTHVHPAERVPISDGSGVVYNGRSSSCASLITCGSRRASDRGHVNLSASPDQGRNHGPPHRSRPLSASASSPALFSFGLTSFDDATVDDCLRVDRGSRHRPAGIGSKRLDRMLLSDVVRAEATHLAHERSPSRREQEMARRSKARDASRPPAHDPAASDRHGHDGTKQGAGPGEASTKKGASIGKGLATEETSPQQDSSREETLLLLDQLERTQLKDGPVFGRLGDRAHRLRRLPGITGAAAAAPVEREAGGKLDSGGECGLETRGADGCGRGCRSPSLDSTRARRQSGGRRVRSMSGGSPTGRKAAGGAARIPREHAGKRMAGKAHCTAPGIPGGRDGTGDESRSRSSAWEEPTSNNEGEGDTQPQVTPTCLGGGHGAAGRAVCPSGRSTSLTPSSLTVCEAGAAGVGGIRRVGCCSGAAATPSASAREGSAAGGATHPPERSVGEDAARGALPDAAPARPAVLAPPRELRRSGIGMQGSKSGDGSRGLPSRQSSASTRHGSGWFKMNTSSWALPVGLGGAGSARGVGGDCLKHHASDSAHAHAGASAGRGGGDSTRPPLFGPVTPATPLAAQLIPPDLDTAAVAAVRGKLRRSSLTASAQQADAARYAAAAARAAAERAAAGSACGVGRGGLVGEGASSGDSRGGSAESTPRDADASQDETSRSTQRAVAHEVVARGLLHARVEQEAGPPASAARWRAFRSFAVDKPLSASLEDPHAAQPAGPEAPQAGVARAGLTVHGMASLAQLASLAQQRERDNESRASLLALANTYTQACADTGTVPVSRVLAHLGAPWLTLRHYRLGPAGGAALARLLPSVGWRSLNLSDNFIGEAGGAVLSVGLSRNRTLTELDLTGNRMGPRAADLILAALCPPRGGGGASAVAPIRTLRVGGNAFGDGATESLRALVADSLHLQVTGQLQNARARAVLLAGKGRARVGACSWGRGVPLARRPQPRRPLGPDCSRLLLHAEARHPQLSTPFLCMPGPEPPDPRLPTSSQPPPLLIHAHPLCTALPPARTAHAHTLPTPAPLRLSFCGTTSWARPPATSWAAASPPPPAG
jgi:hypothetical protein